MEYFVAFRLKTPHAKSELNRTSFLGGTEASKVEQ